jgi:hypothetical protein
MAYLTGNEALITGPTGATNGFYWEADIRQAVAAFRPFGAAQPSLKAGSHTFGRAMVLVYQDTAAFIPTPSTSVVTLNLKSNATHYYKGGALVESIRPRSGSSEDAGSKQVVQINLVLGHDATVTSTSTSNVISAVDPA